MENKKRLSKFMIGFGYFMAVIYVGLGAALLFLHVYPNIPRNIKFAFALFFMAYGIYRFVKMWNQRDEIDN